MSCHTGITGADGLQVWRRSVLASADPSMHALPDRMPASTYHEPVHDLLRWVDVGASHRRLTHTHIHTPWFHRTIRDKNTFKTINNDSNFYIQEIPENWLVFPLHLEFLENGLKSCCWFMAGGPGGIFERNYKAVEVSSAFCEMIQCRTPVSTSWSAVFRDSVVPSHEASLISVRDSKNYHLILRGRKIRGNIAWISVSFHKKFYCPYS